MFEYYLKNKNIYTQTIHLGFFSRFFKFTISIFEAPPPPKKNNLKTKTKTQQQSKRYMKNIKGTENI